MTAHRSLTRYATLAAALTSPVVALWFFHHGHSLVISVLFALLCVAAFRGAVDLALKHLVPPVELTLDSARGDMEVDSLARRRLHFWKRKFRLLAIVLSIISIAWLARGGAWGSNASWVFGVFHHLTNPQVLQQLIILPIFFLANFALFFGPMMLMGISQMQGLEPGDADFGVKLTDVRGQKEAKEEIRKVVTLWQSGARFLASGGKRERGVLFLGPPGTGKTMLAKAIATGFNCPIVLMPGSGFAQTFIGMDVIIVRYMARKARKLAAKWNGSCIIFIDEIDAVGMRRAALGRKAIDPQMPGGGMGGGMGGMGQMGLQSLLVVMDGIDNPPFLRKLLTNKVNLWLDALYLVPQRARFFGTRTLQLRIPKAKPTANQIFFVGATNVPLDSLDPALTRPGRMGRHIHFREPTKNDRIDIFDLYLGKVSHDPELDTEQAREELARITGGYSPASIEQVCSIALTYAHHSGKEAFTRADLLEAMVTVEAGTAVGWGYEDDEEEKATAIHEAGHAICHWLYERPGGYMPTRLSVRKRGDSGGHLSRVETVERFARFRSELQARLIVCLGAYAAEVVFYGENTQGVGGDIGQASALAGTMVGRWGMPPPSDVGVSARELEKLGKQLLAAAGPGDVQLSKDKHRDEAIIVGHAFITAYETILANQIAVQKITKVLLRDKEVYGSDLERLLESCELVTPGIDWDSLNWPPGF